MGMRGKTEIMTDRTLWTRVHSVLLTFVMVATLLAAPPPEIARAAILQVDNVGACSDVTGTPAYCTIQAAYDAAIAGDSIQVAAGTYPAELSVNKNNLTIAGAGAGVTIITAAATGVGQHQIIDNSGQTLTISGVTITGGNTDSFGTIYTATGNLTIQDSVITGNTIGSNGGAVYNNGLGVLNLVRTTVAANTAGGDGGGIYNTDGASLNVIDSIIDGNQGNNGGGIFHRSNAGNLSISGSAIVSNTATVSGGGVYTDAGLNTIVNTTISGNTATPPGGGVGGGIAALSNPALTVTVNNVTISGNTASVGGGLYSNTATSPVRMANSIAFGNSASAGITADCNGAVDVEGPVIIGTYNCSTSLSGSGSVSSSDPLLDPLTTLGATTTHHHPLGRGRVNRRWQAAARGSGIRPALHRTSVGRIRPTGRGLRHRFGGGRGFWDSTAGLDRQLRGGTDRAGAGRYLHRDDHDRRRQDPPGAGCRSRRRRHRRRRSRYRSDRDFRRRHV